MLQRQGVECQQQDRDSQEQSIYATEYKQQQDEDRRDQDTGDCLELGTDAAERMQPQDNSCQEYDTDSTEYKMLMPMSMTVSR